MARRVNFFFASVGIGYAWAIGMSILLKKLALQDIITSEEKLDFLLYGEMSFYLASIIVVIYILSGQPHYTAHTKLKE